MAVISQADDAVARAAKFLRGCLRSGAYGLACYGTDGSPRVSNNKGHIFVASFISEAMSDLFDEMDRTIVLVRILSEDNGGKWGFSPPNSFHRDQFRVFHVDSDDTAYVIRTLQRLGANRDPECLRDFYREATRLFLTFDSPHEAVLGIDPSSGNNMLAHLEVNANIFLALRGTHMENLINAEILRASQDKSGCWRSYFYPSPLFATVLVLEVLDGVPGFETATARGREYVANSQNDDGSWGEGGDPYATALGLSALGAGTGYTDACEKGVRYLLSAMTDDGSWVSPACIWEFHFDEHDVWRAYDRHNAYVTARCLTALRRLSGHSSVRRT